MLRHVLMHSLLTASLVFGPTVVAQDQNKQPDMTQMMQNMMQGLQPNNQQPAPQQLPGHGYQNPMMMAPGMGNPMMGGAANPMMNMNTLMNPMTMMMNPMMMAPMMGMMAPGIMAPGMGNPMMSMMHPPNWVNPNTYSQFMSPNAYMSMMNPMSYMAFMNPGTYQSLMNPNSYLQFMNPSTYGPMLNPQTYLHAMDPNGQMQMMAPIMDPETYTNFYNDWMKKFGDLVPTQKDSGGQAGSSAEQ